MRRRWLLILGGVILGAGLGSCGTEERLASVSERNAPPVHSQRSAPFRFLNGHKPLDPEYNSRFGRFEESFYSFKANYKDLVAQAEPELIAAGFKQKWKGQASYHKGDPNEPSIVEIIDGFRVERLTVEASQQMWGLVPRDRQDPGWICVVIRHRR